MMVSTFVVRDKTSIVLGSHNQSCCGEVEAILNWTSCEEKKTEGWKLDLLSRPYLYMRQEKEPNKLISTLMRRKNIVPIGL